jgi:hypothetical protein
MSTAAREGYVLRAGVVYGEQISVPASVTHQFASRREISEGQEWIDWRWSLQARYIALYL